MKKKLSAAALALALSAAGAVTVSAAEWKGETGSWWYQYDDGTYARNGIKNINGVNYFFDANGYMATGWQAFNFKWYYFEPTSGAQVTGWRQVDGKWYYLDPDDGGSMYTYWLNLGKDRYYLDEQGVMQTGLFFLTDSISGSRYAYEANADGVLYRNTSYKNGDTTIRYDDNGIMTYKNSKTELAAKVSDGDPWKYVLSEKELAEDGDDTDEVIQEALEEVKDDLAEEYKEKVKSTSSSTRRAEKQTTWENKARKKLTAYLLTETEINDYIRQVEYGYYSYLTDDDED